MPDDSKNTHQQSQNKPYSLSVKVPQSNAAPPEKIAAPIKNWNAQRPKKSGK